MNDHVSVNPFVLCEVMVAMGLQHEFLQMSIRIVFLNVLDRGIE